MTCQVEQQTRSEACHSYDPGPLPCVSSVEGSTSSSGLPCVQAHHPFTHRWLVASGLTLVPPRDTRGTRRTLALAQRVDLSLQGPLVFRFMDPCVLCTSDHSKDHLNSADRELAALAPTVCSTISMTHRQLAQPASYTQLRRPAPPACQCIVVRARATTHCPCAPRRCPASHVRNSVLQPQAGAQGGPSGRRTLGRGAVIDKVQSPTGCSHARTVTDAQSRTHLDRFEKVQLV